ncbi:MAG TPA: twin-arginine translocation signal domain-containing protein [Streptosporangiaceae bacterium]|nr:twin-arginine translocation signal domain-containing protein [Streptosporangiaceae bacterium]
MPDLDDSAATAGNSPSRRSVLKGAAGVGAAGLAATTLAGMVTPTASAAADGQPKHEAREATSSEAIVVHVRNAATGELAIYRGEGETEIHDRALAARIVRAAR